MSQLVHLELVRGERIHGNGAALVEDHVLRRRRKFRQELVERFDLLHALDDEVLGTLVDRPGHVNRGELAELVASLLERQYAVERFLIPNRAVLAVDDRPLSKEDLCLVLSNSNRDERRSAPS